MEVGETVREFKISRNSSSGVLSSESEFGGHLISTGSGILRQSITPRRHD